MSLELTVPIVMIVEDDADLCEVWGQQLSEKGYKVMTASKVGDATIKIRNQRFDCILLDMKLEQGTGESVLNSFRDDKKAYNFKTPVLVTSGNLDKDLIQRIHGRVQGFMVKPFNTGDLVSKVESLSPLPKI